MSFALSPLARRRPRNPKIIHRGDTCEKNTISPLPRKTPTQHSSKNKSPSGSMKSPSHTLKQSLRRSECRTKASSTCICATVRLLIVSSISIGNNVFGVIDGFYVSHHKEKIMQLTVRAEINASVSEVWRACTTPSDIMR